MRGKNRKTVDVSSSASTSTKTDDQIALQMDRIWRPVFDKYDTDHDGQIDLDEFSAILKEGNSNLNEEIPAEIIDCILERADWDQNRQLSFDEFLHLVNAREIGAHRPFLLRIIRFAAYEIVPAKERETVVNRYLDETNCMPPPFFIVLITLLQIAIFVYYCVREGFVSATGPIPFDSYLIYNPYRRYEFYRYVTYIFIHAGFIHIFFNIIIQLLIGLPLELVHKWWRVGIVYFAGVLAGSLGASLSDPKTFLCGASGGVYALIAAHISSLIINWKEMEFRWIRFLALLVFTSSDVGVAIYERYSTSQNGNRTSYAAHLSGAIGGLLVGIVVLRNLRVHKWEKVIGWFAVFIYVALMAFLIIFNVSYTSYFYESKRD